MWSNNALEGFIKIFEQNDLLLPGETNLTFKTQLIYSFNLQNTYYGPDAVLVNAGDRVMKTTASVVYNLEEEANVQWLHKPIITNCDKTYEERYSRQKNALDPQRCSHTNP